MIYCRHLASEGQALYTQALNVKLVENHYKTLPFCSEIADYIMLTWEKVPGSSLLLIFPVGGGPGNQVYTEHTYIAAGLVPKRKGESVDILTPWDSCCYSFCYKLSLRGCWASVNWRFAK